MKNSEGVRPLADKKLKLNALEVQSFVTTSRIKNDEKITIKGAGSLHPAQTPIDNFTRFGWWEGCLPNQSNLFGCIPQ